VHKIVSKKIEYKKVYGGVLQGVKKNQLSFTVSTMAFNLTNDGYNELIANTINGKLPSCLCKRSSDNFINALLGKGCKQM
jgi:hypothetical protein